MERRVFDQPRGLASFLWLTLLRAESLFFLGRPLLCLLSVLEVSALSWASASRCKAPIRQPGSGLPQRPSHESQHHATVTVTVILLHCRQAALLRKALRGPSLAVILPGPSPWHTRPSRFYLLPATVLSTSSLNNEVQQDQNSPQTPGSLSCPPASASADLSAWNHCHIFSFTSQLTCHPLYDPFLTSRVPTRPGESPLPSVDQLSGYVHGTVTPSVDLSVRLLVRELLKAGPAPSGEPGTDEGFGGGLLTLSENETRSQTRWPVPSSP